MKEFHQILSKVENKAQFKQICEDAFVEMNAENRPIIQSMELFENYYNLSFDLLQLYRFGKFVKSGAFRRQLEIYV